MPQAVQAICRHPGWRKMVLGRQPVCGMEGWLGHPGAAHGHQAAAPSKKSPCGGFALSTIAHHIVPIRAGGARFDLENGLGVCKACHDWWTATQEPKIYPL